MKDIVFKERVFRKSDFLCDDFIVENKVNSTTPPMRTMAVGNIVKIRQKRVDDSRKGIRMEPIGIGLRIMDFSVIFTNTCTLIIE